MVQMSGNFKSIMVTQSINTRVVYACFEYTANGLSSIIKKE